MHRGYRCRGCLCTKGAEAPRRRGFGAPRVSKQRCTEALRHRSTEGTEVVYQWCGSMCNKFERLKAAQVAAGIRDNERNGRAQLIVVEEGSEPGEMKKVLGRKPVLPVGDDNDDEVADISNRKLAKLYMVSDESGTMQVTLVSEENPFNQSLLLSEECFILDNGTNRRIFVWKGKNANPDERKTAMKTAEGFLKQMGYPPNTQVRVSQGKEPPHLLSLFQGKPLIVYKNGTSRKEGQAPAPPTRLFQVRRNLETITRISEVDLDAKSLNSNDCYVLKLKNTGYIWVGKGASGEEEKGANYLTEVLHFKANRIVEGEEPAVFWDALGGKKDYQTSVLLESKTMEHPPRLYACSNKTGRFIIEEIPGEFTQDDLAEDDVMLLDVWDQNGAGFNPPVLSGVSGFSGGGTVFLALTGGFYHCGPDASPSAKRYIQTDPSRRDEGTPVVIVKQAHEPPTFTGWFLAWDTSKWDTDPVARAMTSLRVA
ncbi:UNVERIFIED_CONTAM: hypothetical protein FKN15_059484 [Acipenser sinensis]